MFTVEVSGSGEDRGVAVANSRMVLSAFLEGGAQFWRVSRVGIAFRSISSALPGSGFGVQGSGFRAQGSGFGV